MFVRRTLVVTVLIGCRARRSAPMASAPVSLVSVPDSAQRSTSARPSSVEERLRALPRPPAPPPLHCAWPWPGDAGRIAGARLRCSGSAGLVGPPAIGRSKRSDVEFSWAPRPARGQSSLLSERPRRRLTHGEGMRDFVESGDYSKSDIALVPEPATTTYNGKQAGDWVFNTNATMAEALAQYARTAVKPEFQWSWRNAGLQLDEYRQTTARNVMRNRRGEPGSCDNLSESPDQHGGRVRALSAGSPADRRWRGVRLSKLSLVIGSQPSGVTAV